MGLLEALGVTLKDLPPGWAGVFLAACVALVWIGQSLRQTLRRSKQESQLVDQLQAALQSATTAAESERARADGVHNELVKLTEISARNGALLEAMKTQLQRETEEKLMLRSKVETLETAVSQLVEEVRNKDRSIRELVLLNRQFLASLSPPP